MPDDILGRTIIEVRAGLDKLEKDLGVARGSVDKASQSMSQSFAKAGIGLTKTLTPAAAGAAAAFGTAFQEIDSGIDSIRAQTGLTGKALEGLGESMKNVAREVTAPISEVGAVMGELRARTGQTGKPLEDLTKQVLELARITGGDAKASVAGLTRLFGDWSVAAEGQAAALDLVFRASQKTGVPVSRLSDLMVQFGAPLRELGFGMTDAAALLGKFEQEGVNTEVVMSGLRTSLGKMAKAGKDPVKTFHATVGQIKGAGTAAEANALAFDLFGAKAGVDLSKAIQEGRFEVGNLTSDIAGGKDTVLGAAADTLDLADKFAIFRNKVQAAIGPFGEFGALAAGGLATVGPMLLGMSQLGGAFGAVGKAFSGLTKLLALNPYVTLIAAGVALTVLIVKNWDTIKNAIGAAVDWVKERFRDFVAGFQSILKPIQKAFDKLPFVGNSPSPLEIHVQNAIGGALDTIHRIPSLASVGASLGQAVSHSELGGGSAGGLMISVPGYTADQLAHEVRGVLLRENRHTRRNPLDR